MKVRRYLLRVYEMSAMCITQTHEEPEPAQTPTELTQPSKELDPAAPTTEEQPALETSPEGVFDFPHPDRPHVMPLFPIRLPSALGPLQPTDFEFLHVMRVLAVQ